MTLPPARLTPFFLLLASVAALCGALQDRSAVLFSETAPECRWTFLGPLHVPKGEGYDGTRVPISGRVTGISVDPFQPETVYLGTALGGVWKSKDAGEHWTPLTDDAPSLAIGAVLAHPERPGLVFAGTGEANLVFRHEYVLADRPMAGDRGTGLLRSTDGGLNWDLVGANLFRDAAFAEIAASPHVPELLLTATSKGLFRSSDLGLTWEQTTPPGPVPHPLEMATSVAFHPTDSDVAYAAFWGRGVFRTTEIRAPAPNWELLTGGLPLSNFGRISLAVTPAVPDALYGLIADADSRMRGFYASHDRGEEWIRVPATPDVLGGQGFFNMLLAAHPTAPGVLFVGGAGDRRTHESSLFRSDPSPDGWGFIPLGSELHIDFHAIAFDPRWPDRIYVGNDGGVWRSDDGGVHWQPLNRGLGTTQFFKIDQHPYSGALLVGGTQDNGTLVYRGGLVWEHVDDGDGGTVVIDPHNPAKVYNVFFQYKIARSVSGPIYGGFTPIYPLVRGVRSVFLAPFALSPTPQKRVALGLHRVYMGGEDGKGWEPISPDLTYGSKRFHSSAVSAIAFSRDDLLYAGTSDGRLWRLEWHDDWETTELTGVPATSALNGAYITDVKPAGEGVVYVAVDADSIPTLWRVYDGDNGSDRGSIVWKEIGAQSDQPLPPGPVFSIEVDSRMPGVLYAATESGVYRSTDDGTRWAPFGMGLPNSPIFDLQLHPTLPLLRAATHGRGVWERDVSGVPCPAVEVYVRDHPLDQGRTGWRIDQGFSLWDSPDVKVAKVGETAVLDFSAFHALRSESIRPGTLQRILVQVGNRGWQTANNVVASIYLSPGPELPREMPGTEQGSKSWHHLSDIHLSGISQTNPGIGALDWSVPSDLRGVRYLLVILDTPHDTIQKIAADLKTKVIHSRHLALKQVEVIP